MVYEDRFGRGDGACVVELSLAHSPSHLFSSSKENCHGKGFDLLQNMGRLPLQETDAVSANGGNQSLRAALDEMIGVHG